MFLTAVVFVVILSILVLVHELGHFLVARAMGVHVEEFGLGLPPQIIGKQIGKTRYTLNWLPIGGFVKLAGEDDESEAVERGMPKSSYFWAKSKKQRALILVAGVTMNFLFAVAITAALLVGGVREPAGKVHVETVVPGSPADVAGLRAGDEIISVGTENNTILVKVPKELIDTVKKYGGQIITISVKREERVLTMNAVPRANPPKGEGPLGVAVSDLELKKYPLVQAPFAAFKINLERGGLMIVGIGQALSSLLSFQKGGAADIAGPIGIAQVTGQAVKFGFRAVLEFMSLLSLNLAILNILPIPALDGGRLAFVFAEKILGRRIRPAFEKQTHQIGMIILLFLVLLVSISDIMRLARGG